MCTELVHCETFLSAVSVQFVSILQKVLTSWVAAGGNPTTLVAYIGITVKRKLFSFISTHSVLLRKSIRLMTFSVRVVRSVVSTRVKKYPILIITVFFNFH